MTTAVLALQGAFAEHEKMLAALGEPCVELRDACDLARPFERLVLCGGESTAQRRLLASRGMLGPLRERIEAGMPTLATCAGLILLAEHIVDASGGGPASAGEPASPGEPPALATFPATAVRNSWGRQLASFHATADFAGIGDVPMTFIRAPHLTDLSDGATPLATVDGRIVAARAKNQLATAFHPELDDDPGIHELFCGM